jgi:hypothetical protein
VSLTPLPNRNIYPPLEARSDREPPDVRLTGAERRFVRRLLAVAARCLSDEGMMHLAGGAEYGARQKRAAQRGPRR